MHDGDYEERGGRPNHAVLYGIIGVLVGILIGLGGSGYAVNNQMTGMLRMMGVSSTMMSMMGGSGTGMNMSMNDMMGQMSAAAGIERDEQFLRMMIVHHQGALALAESAKETTERQELRDMANAIISAQSAEIDQMKQWLKDWFDVDVSIERPAGVDTADHLAHHQS